MLLFLRLGLRDGLVLNSGDIGSRQRVNLGVEEMVVLVPLF